MKTYRPTKIAEAHQGLTVEEYIKQVMGYSGRRIQKLTRCKGILLNGRTAYLQRKVKPGDILSVLVLEDTGYGVLPESGRIDVLYEDDYVIVLNKEPGLLVHPTGNTARGTLANYLAAYFQEKGTVCKIRPLHRLDRETSGCVMFAKDSRTQSRLEELLSAGILKRTYLALVRGHIQPPSGKIDAPIARDPARPNRRIIEERGDRAITHYRTIQTFNGASLLKLNLETGRTHQIRVHLKYAGFPIIGDHMYGIPSPWIARQALHAESLSFRHPVDGQDIMLDAPIPEDFAYAVKMYSK